MHCINGNIDQLASAAGKFVSKYLERDESKMVALLASIEDTVPQMQADTPRAALFQLLVAASDLGELAGTANWDQDDLTQRIERIEACVISAINVFEREHGIDRDKIGGAYFARRDYVPQAWQKQAAG